MSKDWQFGDMNLTTQPVGVLPTDNSVALCEGDLMGSSACSSVSMVDSFSPSLWDHHDLQHLGFGDNNVDTSTRASNTVMIRKGLLVTSRTGVDRDLDMGWNSPNSVPSGSSVLPQSLSQFPVNPAFNEQAARFSCVNGGNLSYKVKPFNISKPMNLYSKSGGPIQGPRDIYPADGLKPFLGAQSQNNESNMAEVSKDVTMSIECYEREKNFVRGSEDGKPGIGVSNNESDKAEFCGCGGQEEPSILDSDGGEPLLAKGLSTKKRKRINQNSELDRAKGVSQVSGEASKSDTETKEKVDHNPTSANSIATGKHGKDGSQDWDSPKEDYIHVRARRGQATNSHSLAERVRREKISERMKFLQELVPGCNRVTGKAVTLDEIINYVQSLQQQIEFLSMKLATVNPLLDLEGLLAKDILQSLGGPSTMGFSPDMGMAHPQQHPSYQGLMQAGISGFGSPSDALRRALISQLTALDTGYKEFTPQTPNMWDDELHNVSRMSFGTNVTFKSEDLNASSLRPGNMKIEL